MCQASTLNTFYFIFIKMYYIKLLSLYGGNWGTERLDNLPTVTQWINDKVKTQI